MPSTYVIQPSGEEFLELIKNNEFMNLKFKIKLEVAKAELRGKKKGFGFLSIIIYFVKVLHFQFLSFYIFQ